ncbi:MAG: hypothetical protein CW346_20360 [Bacillaceae bacterium]|nr:hypothetical protein [Bacillaceae bacterium]
MKQIGGWLPASIFFLSGCILLGASAITRALLYAAAMTRPSWSYPDALIEGMMPGYLKSAATIAFSLAAFCVALPYIHALLIKNTKSLHDESRRWTRAPGSTE